MFPFFQHFPLSFFRNAGSNIQYYTSAVSCLLL